MRDILPKAAGMLRRARAGREGGAAEGGARMGRVDAGALGLLTAAAALLACFGIGLSPAVCAVVVALSFVTTIMSAQSVGQTGIDPMEIFGPVSYTHLDVYKRQPSRRPCRSS